MADKIFVFRLTPEEKNSISEHAELATRSHQDKAQRVWEDLYAYVEKIINDVATQCARGQKDKV
uniref:Uncharacterized protein n=1 Tax=viral metagenome TaxID=1070528 RepID=A0A6M3L2T5_9ZZZZ